MINNWYRLAQSSYEQEHPELTELIHRLEAQYPGLDLWVSETDYKVEVHKIVVPKEQRSQGIGSAIMREIQNYARKVNKPIVLSPEPERGKKKQLDNFYRSLDFVHNKGRKRDFKLSTPFGHTMYWKPQ